MTGLNKILLYSNKLDTTGINLIRVHSYVTKKEKNSYNQIFLTKILNQIKIISKITWAGSLTASVLQSLSNKSYILLVA